MLVTATEAGCAGFILKTSPLDELVDRGPHRRRRGDHGQLRPAGPAAQPAAPPHEEPAHDLTAREREILELIAEGLTNGAIAKRLFISVNTVRNHVQSMLAKLDAHSKLEALSVAIRDGPDRPAGSAAPA